MKPFPSPKKFVLLLISFMWVSCISSSMVNGEKADLIVIGTPINVTSLHGGTLIDAVEGTPDQIDETAAAVQFKIKDVLRGDYIQMKVGGLSRMQQATSAAKKGNVLKLLTLDFKDPNQVVDKPWITVAVKNAYRSFNILNWESPGDQEYKLFFRAVPERPSSYVLIGKEPVV